MTLLLPISGAALAQTEEDIPNFIQAKKPVLCAPLNTILTTLEKAKEKPIAYWTMPGSVPGTSTTVVVYVDRDDGGVSVVESFETGVGCVISYGTDLQLSKEFNAPLKKDLTFKGEDVIYKK
tara:strand:- start:11 stop:376 length:366 start_codon:yes stop_codon:yes gene_type:complete